MKAKKHYGQHFLHETAVIDRILLALAPKPDDFIVEIGPGQGALTLPLLRRVGRLTAIELDRDLLAPLRAAAEPLGQLELISADALSVDFTALATGRPIRLVGNLPYNVSSPLLFHALAHAPMIADMHFMLQREVVERMAAAPGSKVYGRLSVMVQARCRVEPLFRVSPGCFRPPPKVDSAVVRIVPLPPEAVAIADPARFERRVRVAFGKRRKTLSNALAGELDADAIAACGVEPGVRPEQVSVAEWLRLGAACPSPGHRF